MRCACAECSYNARTGCSDAAPLAAAAGSVPALVRRVALIAVMGVAVRIVLATGARMMPGSAARHPRRRAAEHRTTAVAQPRAFVLEAGDDPANVRDLARA